MCGLLPAGARQQFRWPGGSGVASGWNHDPGGVGPLRLSGWFPRTCSMMILTRRRAAGVQWARSMLLVICLIAVGMAQEETGETEEQPLHIYDGLYQEAMLIR